MEKQNSRLLRAEGVIPIIEIVKIKNPFDKTCREIEQVIFVPGKRLTDYIDEPDIDYILNSNFVEQPELTYPADGDQIVIMPHVGGGGMKKILGAIASIMLGNLVGSILKGTAGGIFKGLNGFGKYLAAGAVMAVGGRLINTLFGVKPKALNIDNSTSTPTYGWDLPKPLTGEGNIIGITYGECIPAPQLLESHIDTVNDKQYLNLLLCGGMGPIDEITDIKIGGNPIANYTEVQYDIRLGTNDQTPIPNFGDTTNNQELSYELSESTWATQVVENDGAQGLQVIVEFPNGLYHMNDDGGISTAWVNLAAEYRLTGGTWVTWFGGAWIESTSISGASCYPAATSETWTISITDGMLKRRKITGSISGDFSSVGYITNSVFDNGKVRFTVPTQSGTYTIVVQNNSQISAAQNTSVRRSFRINNLPAGKYEVRMKVASRSAGKTSTRDSTTIYWTQLTSIIYDDFCRPNKVLVGIRILATGQLSGGIPDVTWRQKRNTVYVWNPETNQYEIRKANNPIWAAYDIYHQCRYLKNINTGQYEYTVFGVAHSRLDPFWHEWVECAAYADEQVKGIDGSMENRFEFDAYFDTEEKRYDAAQKAAGVGHATIVPRGNNIGVVCDKPGTMTQVFGEGRTTMSSLQGTFSGIEDRATAVEVVFSDTTNDFKNKPFLVRSPNWAKQKAAQDNPAQLQLFGVKRKSQAYREGVYTLANNLLITQFVDINTDIDALVCQYGDIVGLNHSVSQMGMASGRIVSATANTVEIDEPVDLVANKSYEIMIQFSSDDKLVKKYTVPVSSDATTTILMLTEPFTKIPAQYDNYVFGEIGKSVKPFRLVGVEKTGELTCRLSLAEYVEGVYTGDLNYPLIDYTPPDSKNEVSNLSLAEENYRNKDNVIVSLLHVAWRAKNSNQFLIYYSVTNGLDWVYWESTGETKSTIRQVIPGKTYLVKIVTISEGISSKGVISSPYFITGKDSPPGNITDLQAAQRDKSIIVFGTLPSDPDIKEIEIRIGGNSWANADFATRQSNFPIVITGIVDNTYTIRAKAIDNSGNYSAVDAVASCPISGVNAQRNIILERDDIQLQLGEFVNLIRLPNKILINPQSASVDDFPTNTVDDCPLQVIPDINSHWEYISPVIDTIKVGRTGVTIDALTNIYDENATVDSYPNRTVDDYPFDTVNHITAPATITKYYRVSDTDGTGTIAAVWSAWLPYLPAEYHFRYWQYKIAGDVESTTARTEIAKLYQVYDVPDAEFDEDVTVPVAGLEIDISTAGFYSAPNPTDVHVRFLDGAGKRTWWVDPATVTKDKLKMYTYDLSGNPVQAHIAVHINGY